MFHKNFWDEGKKEGSRLCQATKETSVNCKRLIFFDHITNVHSNTKLEATLMLIRRETVYKQVVEILTEVLSAITENNKKHIHNYVGESLSKRSHTLKSTLCMISFI